MKPYYEEAGIAIYHGDCREILPQLGRFDLLLTDPPYGIRASRKEGFGSGVKRNMTGLVSGKAIPRRDYGDSKWDDEVCSPEVIELMRQQADRQIIWGGNYFPLPPTKCLLLWDKLRGDTDFADGEVAWTNLDKAIRIIRYRWNGFLVEPGCSDDRVHPTQKPLAVMKWCITHVPHAVCSLLDPFMGSGTSLVAAKDLGILATGIELEERYCEIAANRLRQSVLNFETISA